MLDGGEPAQSQARALALVPEGAPQLFEEIGVVRVAAVDLDEQRTTLVVDAPSDEGARGLPRGRLEPLDGDAERPERGRHVGGLGVAGGGAEAQPHDRRRNDGREERREGRARRRVLHEDRPGGSEQQHPAPDPLERPNEVRPDREDGRRAQGDTEDRERGVLDLEPQEVLLARPPIDGQPERDGGDARSGGSRRERVERNDAAPGDEGRDDESHRPERESVVREAP